MATATTTPGNGRQQAVPAPRAIPGDQTSIITAQQALITSQITMVRDIETQLSLSPGPPPAPGTGANIQLVIDNQGAAIRTQAAYIKHLQDTAAALGITLT